MPRKTILYMILMSFMSVVVVAAAGIAYTAHINRLNDLRWCRVLVAIDDAYAAVRNSPTVTPAGRRIANEFHTLRTEFRC